MIIVDLGKGVYVVYLLNKYPYLIQDDNNVVYAKINDNIQPPEWYLKEGAILVEFADLSKKYKTVITGLLSVLSEKLIQQVQTEK